MVGAVVLHKVYDGGNSLARAGIWRGYNRGGASAPGRAFAAPLGEPHEKRHRFFPPTGPLKLGGE
ncbi:MAG: hypothetical protein IBGAMO2_40001 [Arenicellales bacterium IbO2]|nr:MAG: hypothetical protein IBGAMO2_40001 [Arenicellales bacterium IbO2]